MLAVEFGDLIKLPKGSILLSLTYRIVDIIDNTIIPEIDINVRRVLNEDEAFIFVGVNPINRYKSVLADDTVLHVRDSDFKKANILVSVSSLT